MRVELKLCWAFQLISLTVLLVAISYGQAFAQDHLVYRQQYIVKRPRLLGLNGTPSAKIPGFTVRDRSKDHELIVPAIAAQMQAGTANETEIVPFDPNDRTCSDLLKAGRVSSCEPNYVLSIDTTPNDPSYGQLWGLNQLSDIDIDAPEAWDLNTGSQTVVVAVIDTGIEYTHPELAANMWQNPGELPGNGIDDDANGYIDDIYGINAITNSGDPMDDNNHGTHVAGTIGAVGNNSLGVVGVNWQVKLIGAKFLSASGSGSLLNAIKAIDYVTDLKLRGVNVVLTNNSWGGGGFSQSLADAITRANNAGVLFVAAAGNSASNNDLTPAYPAGYTSPNVISVAALSSTGNLASFSNYGETTVDIAAPGVGILSTIRGASYGSMSGTSMATPHVSGALALLSAYAPTLTPTQLIDRLYLTGTQLPSLVGVVSTQRLLNVNGMLRDQSSPLPTPTPTPTPFTYTVEEQLYNPDQTVLDESIIIQADELNYYPLNLTQLGFTFPFFGSQVSQLWISPNGVVYLAAAPTGYDWNNGSSAPNMSIAALHTDMIATANPLGVRYLLKGNTLIINWQTEQYQIQGLGVMDVQLEINSNGILSMFYNFSSSTIEQFVRLRGTVGIKATTVANTYTYQANDSKVHSALGLRFIPAGVTAPVPEPTNTPTPEPSLTPSPEPSPTSTPSLAPTPSPSETPQPTQSPAPELSISLEGQNINEAWVLGEVYPGRVLRMILSGPEGTSSGLRFDLISSRATYSCALGRQELGSTEKSLHALLPGGLLSRRQITNVQARWAGKRSDARIVRSSNTRSRATSFFLRSLASTCRQLRRSLVD